MFLRMNHFDDRSEKNCYLLDWILFKSFDGMGASKMRIIPFTVCLLSIHWWISILRQNAPADSIGLPLTHSIVDNRYTCEWSSKHYDARDRLIWIHIDVINQHRAVLVRTYLVENPFVMEWFYQIWYSMGTTMCGHILAWKAYQRKSSLLELILLLPIRSMDRTDSLTSPFIWEISTKKTYFI